MSIFRNFVTLKDEREVQSCTLSSLIDDEVVKYMKISFVGNNKALDLGIGNIWIKAYEKDHLHNTLRPRIEFDVQEGDLLYEALARFATNLGGETLDNTDPDYESNYTMKATIKNDSTIAVVFEYKYGEYPDCSEVDIKVDYQYCDEKAYNALAGLYGDLKEVAYIEYGANKQNEKIS